MDNNIRMIIEREERLSSILNNIDVGLLLQGPNSEIFMSNEKAFEMLGLTEDQILGRTSFDSAWNVIKEDGSLFSGEYHPVPQAIATKMPVKDVIMGVYRPVKGDRIWLSVNAIPILNEDGSLKYVVCSFIDISDEKHAKDQFSKSHNELSILYKVYKNTTENLDLKELFKNALNIIKESFLIDGIAIYTITKDLETLVFEDSVGFSDILVKEIQVVKKGEGLAGRAIVIGTPQFASFKDYPEGKFKSLLVDQGFKSMISIPMMVGHIAVGAISIALKREKTIDSDELQLLKAVSRQIAITVQNAQLIESLKNESTIDPLTGLYNRRYMLVRINEEMANFKRHAKKFFIVIADIDYYKSVNDTYGHDFGDYVLKIISEILKSNLRGIDCLSRWGGDEFLMLLTETDIEAAHATIERIRKKVEEKSIEYNNKSLALTMTFGVSIFHDNDSIDDIIKKADNALYIGKNNGRNCVFVIE